MRDVRCHHSCAGYENVLQAKQNHLQRYHSFCFSREILIQCKTYFAHQHLFHNHRVWRLFSGFSRLPAAFATTKRTLYMPRSTTRMWETLERFTSGILPLHAWDSWHMLTASGITNTPIRPTRDQQRNWGEHPKPLSLHHVSSCVIL